MSWWAWQSPGGTSQPSVVQPPSRTPMATRMGSVWKRHFWPTSRTWPLPPRTIGMIPAEQASRRASGAEMWPPVSRVQTPAASRSARSWSRVMVTTTVAPQPPVFGSSREVMDSMSSVNAIPSRTGAGRSGSIPAQRTRVERGEGEDHLAQHLPVPGRDPEPAVGGAFVVLPHRERRPPQRLGLFAFQRLALEALGEVGGDHLEDPPADHPQRLGVVLGRATRPGAPRPGGAARR